MKKLLILSLLSIFLLAACNTTTTENAKKANNDTNVETSATNLKEDGDEANETPEQIAKEKAENVNSEQSTATPEITESQNPQYIAYSKTTYNELLGKKAFALFFHAPWCPVCVGMEKDFKENLSSFPNGSIILKTDFDTEKELEKKYGITTQSTIVIIDKEGKAVKTLAAPESSELIEEITTVL